MYSYIKGRLVEVSPAIAVVETGGIGYSINISVNTYTTIKESEACKLLIYLHVREDVMELYGFATEQEKTLFKQLITVNGVGVNTARVVLSTLSPEELVNAILSDDVLTLKKVKGIGPKAAQRIILDLKDKLVKSDLQSEIIPSSHNTVRDEALSGLAVLGFPRNSAAKIVDKVIAKEGDSISVEVLIKQALKAL